MTWVSRGGETVRVRPTGRYATRGQRASSAVPVSVSSPGRFASRPRSISGTDASGPDESEHHANLTPAEEPPTWCPVDPQGVNRLRLVRITQHDGLRESRPASGERFVDPTESDPHGEDGGDVSGRAYRASRRMRVREGLPWPTGRRDRIGRDFEGRSVGDDGGRSLGRLPRWQGRDRDHRLALRPGRVALAGGALGGGCPHGSRPPRGRPGTGSWSRPAGAGCDSTSKSSGSLPG